MPPRPRRKRPTRDQVLGRRVGERDRDPAHRTGRPRPSPRVSWFPGRQACFAVLRMLLAFFFALALLGIAGNGQEPLDRGFVLLRYGEMMLAGIVVPSRRRLRLLEPPRGVRPRARAWRYCQTGWRSTTAACSELLSRSRRRHRSHLLRRRPFRYKRSGDHLRFDLTPEAPDVGQARQLALSRRRRLSPAAARPGVRRPQHRGPVPEPKVLRPVRRWQKAFPSKVRMGPPLHKRKSRRCHGEGQGTRQAKRGPREVGVVKPITLEMAGGSRTTRGGQKESAPIDVARNAILFVLVIGQASIPLIIALND